MTEKIETLTFRTDPETAKEVEELARKKLKKKSEVIREAFGLKGIKELASKKYAKGEISFEELVELLGYREARKSLLC